MKNCNNAELINLIRQSDHAAFDELHRRFWQPLFRIAQKKLGDADETDDLLQELFLDVWLKRESLEFSNAVDSWLRNRLWFKIADHFKSRGFKERHLENFRVFLEQDAATATDDEAQYEEILQALTTQISIMPEKMQEIFRLNHTGSYSVNKIAEKLGLSPHTVKTQLKRARSRLRKIATENGTDGLELLLLFWLINH